MPPDTPASTHALSGTAQFNGCAGVVFRSPASRPRDRAMLLTNGHCANTRPRPGHAIRRHRDRNLVLLQNAHGETVMRANTKRLVYATMTGTDVAVYRLDRTYASLRASGVKIRALAAHGPRVGQKVTMLAPQSGEDWTCRIGRVVPRLSEGGYTQVHALRYTFKSGCSHRDAHGDGPGHGDSGSPLVDRRTGRIVGIHNTGNDEGRRCVESNPCEINADGTKSSKQGRRYGQQTADLRGCLISRSRIALNRPGCTLTR